MKTKQLLLSILALALLAVMPAVAQADPVTLTLPSSVNVTAGEEHTVIGTIANAGAPDFNISSWSINLSDPLLTFDDTAFLASPLVLGAGQTMGLRHSSMCLLTLAWRRVLTQVPLLCLTTYAR